MTAAARPWILFGAFDRHNLGDLLLAHVAEAMLRGRRLHFAGLAARDLRPWGGHRVEAIAELAAGWGDAPANLLHVGGEVLSCDAWTAAAMLLPPAEAPAAIAQLERDAEARAAWVRRTLGSAARAPYAAGASFFAPGLDLRVAYHGVGGADLDRADPALRAEVVAALRAARRVAVRDWATLAAVEAAGIAVRLVPDAAVLAAQLFGPRVEAALHEGEAAVVRAAFPQGWIALQCSAEFGDDDSLDRLAAPLRELQRDTGWGVALLRAGTAPWHDDAAVLRRLAARLAPAPVHGLEATNLWTLLAVVAGARLAVASSLHIRLVALAFEVPRLTVRSPVATTAKHAAVVDACDRAGGQPGVVDLAGLGDAVATALAVPAREHASRMRTLAGRCRAEFAALRDALDAPG